MQQPVRTIRLDHERIAEILDRLDQACREVDQDMRSARRFPYRYKALVVHMQQPGASAPEPYLVPTRDIAEGGASFLHGGYVHTGTRCLVQLITTAGTWTNVVATVARCRHVGGTVHEVGLKFDHEIDAALYSTQAIRSHILLVEDDATLARLALFFLEQLGADVDHVTDGAAAINAAKKTEYDLILMDIHLPDIDGITATRTLREAGYRGEIVATTGVTQPEEQQQCIEAGCDRLLPKPYRREDLQALIRSLHDDPLCSTYHDDPAMAGLLYAFGQELSAKARAIGEARVRNDRDALTTILRELKSESGSYGFGPISHAASQIESLLLKGDAIESMDEPFETLLRRCRQARASVRIPPPDDRSDAPPKSPKQKSPNAKPKAAAEKPAVTDKPSKENPPKGESQENKPQAEKPADARQHAAVHR
jgi:CheY-like chemotaxis protein